MDNSKIADAFDELAELLEFRGENPFRVRAYRNGARAIRDLDESVASILADPARSLADLPGIGETLAEKSKVLVETGTLPQLETLREAVPDSVLAMTRVPGLGAKKAAVLHKELNIQSLEELKAACEQFSSQVERVWRKTEESILAGLAIASAASERIYWCDADEIVQSITAHMKQSPSIVRMSGRKLSARPRNGGRSRLAGSQHRP